MGGKIALYYDCVSPYSWFALIYLLKQKKLLISHGVELELNPVFLGGIMQKSGNQPPWKVERKAVHSSFDTPRSARYFGVEFKKPDFFPIVSLLPQRALTFVKDNYSSSKLELAALSCSEALYNLNSNISKPDEMRACLSRVDGLDVEKILEAANSPPIKAKLLETTDKALASGAYGCPWFEVTNGQGIKEPFFGSDRFHHMWQFLGLPWTDLQIEGSFSSKI